MNLPIDNEIFNQLADWAQKVATENKIEYGLAEMALGAAILTWGVKHDAIALGAQVVGLAVPGLSGEAKLGSGTGVGLGLLAGNMIESIGIAGGFGAIGVPGAVLAGGAAVVLGAVGYTVGDLADRFSAKVDEIAPILPLSALALGTAMLLHGAYRAANDERLPDLTANLKNSQINLGAAVQPIIFDKKEAFDAFVRDMHHEPAASVSALSGAGVGAVVGGSAATASVTLLGSQALGSAALSLGLVSAPIWPIAAGVLAGGAVGYGLWKLATKRRDARPLALPSPQLKLPPSES